MSLDALQSSMGPPALLDSTTARGEDPGRRGCVSPNWAVALAYSLTAPGTSAAARPCPRTAASRALACSSGVSRLRVLLLEWGLRPDARRIVGDPRRTATVPAWQRCPSPALSTTAVDGVLAASSPRWSRRTRRACGGRDSDLVDVHADAGCRRPQRTRPPARPAPVRTGDLEHARRPPGPMHLAWRSPRRAGRVVEAARPGRGSTPGRASRCPGFTDFAPLTYPARKATTAGQVRSLPTAPIGAALR